MKRDSVLRKNKMVGVLKFQPNTAAGSIGILFFLLWGEFYYDAFGLKGMLKEMGTG